MKYFGQTDSHLTRRASLGRSLAGLGLMALISLLSWTAEGPAVPTLLSEGSIGGREQEKSPKAALDQLLADYQAFGLPLPPKDAKLVRYTVRYSDKTAKPDQFLGFLLGSETRNGKPTAILWSMSGKYALEVQPHVVVPESVSAKDFTFYPGEALLTAIQCHARGWTGLAEHLYGIGQKTDERPPHGSLMESAWDYNRSLLCQPDNNRRALSERLGKLARLESRLQTEENLYLLTHLDWALVPSKAKPGTIQALIDELVESRGDLGSISSGQLDTDPRFCRVALLGFEAVPYLIDHLDDWRLTRGYSVGFNNFRPYHLRVCHLVSQILQGLAHEHLGGWQIRGDPAEKEVVVRWWQRARKVGEEKYLVYHVLFSGPSNGAGTRWPNDLMLRLIQVKYPRRLPEIYLHILADHPDIQSWPVAEALVRSSLPAKVKLGTLLQAAQHPEPDHHRAARWYIQAILPW